MAKQKKRRKAKRRTTGRPTYKEDRAGRVLDSFGILEDFKTIKNLGFKEFFRETVMRRGYSKFQLIVDEKKPQDKNTKKLRQELERTLKRAVFEIESFVKPCSIQDYISVAFQVGVFLEKLSLDDQPNISPEAVQRLKKVEKVLTDTSVLEGAILEMLNCILRVLIKYNKEIDTGFYYTYPEYKRLPDKGTSATLTLYKENPSMTKIALDGKKRKVYRCGVFIANPDIKWIQWDSTKIPQLDKNKIYDVYVQMHAINRLFERLSCLEESHGALYQWMWNSFLEPNCIRQSDNSFLVEFLYGPYKLGYFKVYLLEDKAIVRSFLFLTMSETPEGDKLYKAGLTPKNCTSIN